MADGNKWWVILLRATTYRLFIIQSTAQQGSLEDWVWGGRDLRRLGGFTVSTVSNGGFDRFTDHLFCSGRIPTKAVSPPI